MKLGHHRPGEGRSGIRVEPEEPEMGRTDVWLAEAGFDAATPSCNFVAFVVYEIRTPSTGEGRSRIRAEPEEPEMGRTGAWLLKQALTLPILPC